MQQCQDEDVECYASSFFKQQESLSAKSSSTYSAPIKYTDGIVDHQARSACGMKFKVALILYEQ